MRSMFATAGNIDNQMHVSMLVSRTTLPRHQATRRAYIDRTASCQSSCLTRLDVHDPVASRAAKAVSVREGPDRSGVMKVAD
jgi:hypothetical protein